MSDSWLTAFALMLVIEGLLPFAVPSVWRDTFRKLTDMNDGQIRFIGLISILSGLAFLLLFRSSGS
jgi:uncharacterized protein